MRPTAINAPAQARSQTRLPCRAIVVALLAALPAAPARADGTEIVGPASMNGWSTSSNAASAVGTFDRGPATPPAGVGSFRQELGASGTETHNLETARYNGMLLADFSAIAYSTYVVHNTDDAQASAVNLVVDLDGDGRFTSIDTDDFLVFEPVYQSGDYAKVLEQDTIPDQCANQRCLRDDQWQRWDAKGGGWWSAREGKFGPPLYSWNGYLATHPGAKLVEDRPAFRLKAGSGQSWNDFDGYVDALTVNGTTFDFEPNGWVHCVPDTSVDPSCRDGHATIQQASDHTLAGDAILVGPGTWIGFTIGEGVSVRSTRGPADTVVVPSGNSQGVVVSFSPRARLEGFTVDGTGGPLSGVVMIGAGSVVRGNVIRDSTILITLNDTGLPGQGVLIENNVVRDGVTGVYMNPLASDHRLRDNVFTGLSGTGVLMGTEGGFRNNRFERNRFEGNKNGIVMNLPAGAPNAGNVVFENCFSGQTTDAVRVAAGNAPLDAQGNWWGAADGPSGDFAGSGDSARGPVQVDPFNAACVPAWIETGANPVLGDALYPTVLDDGGQFRMWFEHQTATTSRIGYAESADGRAWVVEADLAIPGPRQMRPSAVKVGAQLRLYTWDGVALRMALSNDDGVTWTDAGSLEFIEAPPGQLSAVSVVAVPGGWAGYFVVDGAILRAETADPAGRTGWRGWSVVRDANACRGACSRPAVLSEADGYRMWYGRSESDTGGYGAIEYATSIDGLTFIDAPGPALTTAGAPAWRTGRTYTPAVTRRDDLLRMWFTGRPEAEAGTFAIGLASDAALPADILVDCDDFSDDIHILQGTLDAAGAGVTLRLRGLCDLSAAAAHGGDNFTNAAAAVIVDQDGTTVVADDPDEPARVAGGGDETAFYVAPGTDSVTIRGLEFAAVGRAVVAEDASSVTVEDNVVTGSATMSQAILGLSGPPGPIAFGPGGTLLRSPPVTDPATDGLSNFVVRGNRIAFNPPGTTLTFDRIGVDVRQRGGVTGYVASGIAIQDNDVDYRSPDLPLYGMRAIGATTNDDTAGGYPIRDVTVSANRLGRADPASFGGRAGIALHAVDGFAVSGNSLRTRVTSTALPNPGGGIVVHDSRQGTVEGNVVEVIADPGNRAASLGGVAIVDNLYRLFGYANSSPLATEDVSVTGNTIGGLPERGLVVTGVARATVTGNTVTGAQDKSLWIGVGLQGPGNFQVPGPTTLPPQAVADSYLCGNTFNGVADDPAQTGYDEASQSTNNRFPAGAAFGNRNCPAAGGGSFSTLSLRRPWPGGVKVT